MEFNSVFKGLKNYNAVFITKTYQLNLNKEIIAVRSENYTKYLQCAGENADFLNLTSDGAYSYHGAVTGQKT